MDELLVAELQRIAEIAASKKYKRLYHVRILEKGDLINSAWVDLLIKLDIIIENGVIAFGLALKIAENGVYMALRKAYSGPSREFVKRSSIAVLDDIAFTQEKPRQWAADQLDLDLEFFSKTLERVNTNRFQSLDDLPVHLLVRLAQDQTNHAINSAQINAALSVLTNHESQIISAYYFHGLDQNEAARKLNITIDSFRSGKVNAKQKLRKHFSNNG